MVTLRPGGLGAAATPATAKAADEVGAIPLPFFLSIMGAIEAREPFPAARARNIALYAVATARALLLPADQIDAIRIGALLANIGMIHVPEDILRKTTALTAPEQEIIRRHPVLGAEILASVPQLGAALPLVLHHHEDWGGGGYPSGIGGDPIPLGARIIRVVETYDALTGTRPYRPAYSPAEALELLSAGAGREFDPRVVTAFAMRMRRGAISDEILDRWEGHQHAARAWRTRASAQGF